MSGSPRVMGSPLSRSSRLAVSDSRSLLGQLQIAERVLNVIALDESSRKEMCLKAAFGKAVKGDWSWFEQIPSHLFELALRDKEDRPLLIHALAERNCSVVAGCLKRNINTRYRDVRNNTPLHSAAEIGHAANFEQLLSVSDGTVENLDGETPIDVALRYGNDRIILSLLGVDEVAAAPEDPVILDFANHYADQLFEARSRGAVGEEILQLLKLAGFFLSSREIERAVRHYKAALAICQKPLLEGYLKRKIAQFETELALFCSDTFYSDEAHSLEMELKSLESLKDFLKDLLAKKYLHQGNLSVAVAPILMKIGSCLMDQKEPQRALKAYKEALRIFQKNPTSEILMCVGRAFEDLGQMNKALKYFKQARELQAPESPNFARAQIGMARLQRKRGNSADSPRMQQQAQIILKEVFIGEATPDLFDSYYEKGCGLEADAQVDEALESFQEALVMARKLHEEPHEDVIKTLNQLGTLWMNLGNPEKTLVYFQELLQLTQKVFWDDQRKKVEAFIGVGKALFALGNLEEAYRKFQDALVFKMQWGRLYCHLGQVAFARGEHEAALEHFLDSLKHPLDDLEMAFALERISEIYYEYRENDLSLKYQGQAWAIRKRCYQKRLDEVSACNNIGGSWILFGYEQRALPYLNRALEAGKGQVHQNVAETLWHLGDAYRWLGDRKQALMYLYRCHKMKLQIFGEYHPETQTVVVALRYAMEEGVQILEELKPRKLQMSRSMSSVARVLKYD